MTAVAPRVELRLPSVLKVIVGRERVSIRGRSVHEALEAAFVELPQLRYQLTLDSGELRPHLLCIVNGECLQRTALMTTALSDGDEIQIHQAISGG